MSEESQASGIEDMIRKKNLESYEDIEEDEQEAYTRCDSCGLRIKLKHLKKHKELIHDKISKN